MDSDNSIKKLLTILEPLVWDLEDKKRYLANRKEELESVSRLLAYTKDNIEMVGIYADQDLILSSLPKMDYTKEDYKASCYLLKSEDESVKLLPQYEKAHNLISDIIEYFKLYKTDLTVDIQELKEQCVKKEIEKKYFDILSTPSPLIEDVDEFRNVLDDHGLEAEDKIKILISTIKSNIANYESGNK